MRRNGVSMDIRELRTEHIEFSGEIMDRVLRSAILNSNVIDVIQDNKRPFDELMSKYRCAIMEIETKFKVLNEQYSSKIDGLPGNDDLGTMGAWYVFACIGLYPEIPGVGGFTVNTPIFSSVKVHLKKGDIVIKGGSEKNIYIKNMKLNGKPYDSTWLDWDQLNNGATIEYTTSSKPDVKWGTKVTPPSFP